MKKKKQTDRVESVLKKVHGGQTNFQADGAWQRNLMDRVRGSARSAERREPEFPVWRFAWAAAAMAAMVLGVSLLTMDSSWIPDSYLFNVQQAVINL